MGAFQKSLGLEGCAGVSRKVELAMQQKR